MPLLEAFGTPRDFGLLSLDIDSYDHDVLDAVLDSVSARPRLHGDQREKIPPPVKFSVDYRAQDFRCGGEFSLDEPLDARRSRRPSRLRAGGAQYNNAFLEPRERVSVPAVPVEEGVYRRGYLDRPDRRERMPWNEDMEAVQGLTPDDALEWVRDRFSEHEGRFTCEL